MATKKKEKKPAPLPRGYSGYNPFAGTFPGGQASRVGGLPAGYNPFAGIAQGGPASGAGAQVYGYTPPVQSLSGGIYSPYNWYMPRTTAGPQVFGYTPGMYGGGGQAAGGGGGGGNGGGGQGVGYFPGVANPYREGEYYGGGWGNPNFVWGGEGYYRPSYYGRRAYGLSAENVNQESGELQGSLNRFGQPLGTEAPLQAQGPRRKYPGWSSTTPYGPWKNRIRPNPGKGGGGTGGGGGGGTTQQSKSGPIWYNDLINWNM